MRRGSTRERPLGSHKLQTFNVRNVLLVLLSTAVITAFEIKVPFIDHDFAAILYFLLLTVTTLLGDYASGILALLLGAVCLDYLVPPMGFDLSVLTERKILLFLMSGIVICGLSWRARSLQYTNKDLFHDVNELQRILVRMQQQAKGNKKELAKLSAINKQLDKLVSQFIGDDEYWRKRLETQVGNLEASRRPSPKTK